MKKLLLILTLFSSFQPRQVRADFWGADVVVLGKILINALQQLYQLRQIIGNARNQLKTIQDINRGINEALGALGSINSQKYFGKYDDWLDFQKALKEMQEIYGAIELDSPSKTMQEDTDSIVTEAITKNSNLAKYTEQIDIIGEQVKMRAQNASPKGAARLTAQTLGVILHVLNENLRFQGSSLKLQAQELARKNATDKHFTNSFMKESALFSKNFKAGKASFQIPKLKSGGIGK